MVDSMAPEAQQTQARPRGRMRAAQREFTRSRLIDAAIEIFAERGYAKATVDEIADRAGATRATFYLHFKAKSDMISELMVRGEEHYRSVYQDLGPIAHAPTTASVRRWLATAMREWDSVVGFVRPINEAASIEPQIHALTVAQQSREVGALAEALRSGEPALSVKDAEVYASVLLAPLRYYFELHMRGQRFDERRVLDVMATSWMAVIGRIAEQPKRRRTAATGVVA
ncbi:helix-turn-helix domain-containing protein [Dactylosporangium sp. NPDC051485]|uniref:TetR/AcrR family transcriptional regulator n=1 Tax=Dactylosporangium sp. NPDC051485 TaxID=3154846 RepID=UPI0034136601